MIGEARRGARQGMRYHRPVRTVAMDAAHDATQAREAAAGTRSGRLPSALLRPIGAILVVAFVATLAPFASAQVAPAVPAGAAPPAQAAPSAAHATAAIASAPVQLGPRALVSYFNRPIIEFRGLLLGVGPAERADAARLRVEELLGRGGDGKVTVEDVPQGAVVLIDRQMAFVVVHEDAHAVPGATARSLADLAARRIEQVASETREARDTKFLLRAAMHAALATFVWMITLLLAWALWRWTARHLMRLANAYADRVAVGGAAVVSRDALIASARRVVAVVGVATMLLLTWEWLGVVLGLFPYTRPWSEGLTSFLVTSLLGILVAILRALPELFIAVAIFVIAWFVDRVQRGFFEQVIRGRVVLGLIDRDTATPTRRLVSIAVWLFAIAMAYPYIPGSDTDAFKGLSVLIGLMVTVGASGIVGQAMAGLILMYTRTFRPGEYIRVADREGTVTRMGGFTTFVRTGLGEELALPNAFVLGNVVTNFSRETRGPGFMLDVPVTIGYDAPWRQVHALLLEAASRTQGVRAEPEPRVYQTALSDFYVEYRLVCQASAADPQARAALASSLRAAIQDAFNAAGVQIMSPHYLGDPAHPKVVPPERWQGRAGSERKSGSEP
jgi:small-conductance mechanosensitive channel